MMVLATTMDLNLLPSEAKFQAAKIRLENKAKLIMAIMLIVWISAILIVFAASFVFSTKLKSEESLKKKALSEYSTLSDSVIVNQGLKYKAKMVGKTLATRFEYGKAFETVNSIFPEGIALENFEMDPGGFFKVSGTTVGRQNVDKLEGFVNAINGGSDSRFVSIRLSSLTVKSGVWRIGMEVTLK